MVYPTEYLLQRDLSIFQKYWNFNKVKERVIYHFGLEFDKNVNNLIIVDESDALLFEQPKLFNDFISKNPCICLTATPGNDSDGVEKKVLEHLGFKVIDDDRNFANRQLKVDKEADEDEIYALLQENQSRGPVLLFCNDQLADYWSGE